MILPAQEIRRLCRVPLIFPFHERTTGDGMTYGLGPAGYDVRIAEEISLPPHGFALGSTMERFDVPPDLMLCICDKSSWARRGLSVFNSRGEPGWSGFLTIELVNHSHQTIELRPGMPIAHIVFERLAEPTAEPYRGRYQGQKAGPQPAIEAK